jgi:hypothetical protein
MNNHDFEFELDLEYATVLKNLRRVCRSFKPHIIQEIDFHNCTQIILGLYKQTKSIICLAFLKKLCYKNIVVEMRICPTNV